MTQAHQAGPRDGQTDREIDKNLKRAFDQIANEPVPDRFTDLLKQLQQKEAAPDSAAAQTQEAGAND